jgi:hypothetical protein
MIKCDELSNPKSCINRAADDEPVFVLRAHDPCAPEIVREWADAYATRKEENGGVMNDEQRAKYQEARALATQMEVWQKAHGVKSWT